MPPLQGWPEQPSAGIVRWLSTVTASQVVSLARGLLLLVLLVFSEPNCGPYTALLPDLARWQNKDPDKLTLALVSRGTAEANRAKLAAHGLSHVLLQQDREVAQAVVFQIWIW